MNKNLGIVILIISLFIFAGCEALFTTSAFEKLAADPSDMSPAQLETYAEGIAQSGDSDAMAEAFDAVEENLPADAADDPELYLLAADLALGGSGLTEAIVDVAAEFTAGTIEEFDLVGTVESIDSALLISSVDLFEDVVAVEGAEITDSQYANAAAAQALVIINEAEDMDSIDLDDDRWDNVIEWGEAGNVDLNDLLGLEF